MLRIFYNFIAFRPHLSRLIVTDLYGTISYIRQMFINLNWVFSLIKKIVFIRSSSLTCVGFFSAGIVYNTFHLRREAEQDFMFHRKC